MSQVVSFIELTDTPETYEGNRGKVVVVNDTEDGIEFKDITISQSF